MARRLRKPKIILRADPNGSKQPAIEPSDLLLMMEAVSRWALYDHRHKTFLSKELIWIAARAVDLRADKTHWTVHPRWPARAFAMGVDHKTIRVIDEKRFRWFWYQLGEKGKFSIKWQRELMESGKEPPEMLPLIITKPYIDPGTIRQRQQAKAVKEYQDNSRSQEIMDHFFV